MKNGGFMGIEDRDYYREWWKKKQGFVEKVPFRLPASKPKDEMHWVLTLLLSFFLCVLTYWAVRWSGRLLIFLFR